jgi:ABC-type antimicrobial peptide transport system permease subunit
MNALGALRRTPALTAIAFGSIAITIGATAVVFTAIKTVLLDPLPYANADQLVQFRTDSSRAGFGQREAGTILAVAIVTFTAAVACFIPAHRATRIDPMLALRRD